VERLSQDIVEDSHAVRVTGLYGTHKSISYIKRNSVKIPVICIIRKLGSS
jgi:hypothetical protein